MEPGDQLIRYAEVDGCSVAWSAVGSGPPLVLGGWWCSNLALDWRNARFRRFVSAFAAHRTVIRYDRPGTGASDHDDPPPADLEAELAILEAIVATAVGDAAEVAVFGARLVLSPHTVHRHLANIRTKLGVPSRAAAAAWALRHGLI